jgi:hypothetical protein
LPPNGPVPTPASYLRIAQPKLASAPETAGSPAERPLTPRVDSFSIRKKGSPRDLVSGVRISTRGIVSRQRIEATFVVAICGALLGACGGSASKPSTRSQAPPGAEVSSDVASIVSTCIQHSFNPGTTSIGPVSEATGDLVRLSKTYSLSATMTSTSTKAHTLSNVLSTLLPTLQACSPADASRVDSALYASAGG